MLRVAAKDEHRERLCAESQTGLYKNEDSWTSTVEVDVDPLIPGAVDESVTWLSLATCGNSARRQAGSATDLLETHLETHLLSR